MTDPTDAQAIIDTAIASCEPDVVDPADLLSVIVPDGAEHRIINNEQFLARPRRKRGTVTLLRPESLVAYVADETPEPSMVTLYADVGARRVTAVLNEADGGWGDHRADLDLRPSVAWRRWTARDGEIGKQVTFAEHIEDCIADIADPAGAELLELAQTFEATTQVEFRSAQRLTSGQRQLLYKETTEAKAGQAGQITIPQTFLLVIAPFEGSEPCELQARLRYRIDGGALRIGYVLDRPDLVLKGAFLSALDVVETALGITAYYGTPATP